MLIVAIPLRVGSVNEPANRRTRRKKTQQAYYVAMRYFIVLNTPFNHHTHTRETTNAAKVGEDVWYKTPSVCTLERDKSIERDKAEEETLFSMATQRLPTETHGQGINGNIPPGVAEHLAH